MGQNVQLLENALRAWEDLFLIYEARVRAGIASNLRSPTEFAGPVRHWRELRNHLLNLKGGDFDVDRFCHREAGTGLLSGPVRGFVTGLHMGMGEAAGYLNEAYRSLPLQLASWMISSRRVFRLSDEMVARFVAADYSNYTWSDLLWPFDSFLIEFDAVLESDSGNTGELKGLLVSSVYNVAPGHPLASKEGFECLMFATAMDGVTLPEEVISFRDRERLEKDIRHKRWMKLNDRLAAVFKRMLGHDPIEMVHAMLAGDQSLFNEDTEPFHRLPAGFGSPACWEKSELVESSELGPLVGKIVAGLCLYLEALPATTVENYPWRQSVPAKLPREVRKIITEGELVCEVNDFNTISPETMTLFPETLKQGPAYTVTPHWRRAHYRRPKGQGKNPDAPKTVKIEATLVHKDQLPEGTLPGGAVSSVR